MFIFRTLFIIKHPFIVVNLLFVFFFNARKEGKILKKLKCKKKLVLVDLNVT